MFIVRACPTCTAGGRTSNPFINIAHQQAGASIHRNRTKRGNVKHVQSSRLGIAPIIFMSSDEIRERHIAKRFASTICCTGHHRNAVQRKLRAVTKFCRSLFLAMSGTSSPRYGEYQNDDFVEISNRFLHPPALSSRRHRRKSQYHARSTIDRSDL